MLTAKEKRDLLMGRYEAKRQQIDSRIAADIECYRKGDCRIKVADGAVVGTTFKYNGKFENQTDKARVKEFMDKVKSIR